MADTPLSLLERLRLRPDDQAWKRLVDLYTPLLQGWFRRHSIQSADADDLVQKVLQVVVRKLPQFEHKGTEGAFRGWLRQIMKFSLDDFRRSQRSRPLASGGSDIDKLAEQLEDPASGISRLWDQEHDRHVTQHFLKRVQGEFEPTTWQAFVGVVLEGKKTSQVTRELGISANAVRIAKSRVLRRLRQEAKDLID